MTIGSGPPPLPSERVDEPSKLEVAGSIVIPGTGQILQRRWASAVPQLLLATIFLVIIMNESLMPLYKLLQALSEQKWEIDENSIVAPRMPTVMAAEYAPVTTAPTALHGEVLPACTETHPIGSSVPTLLFPAKKVLSVTTSMKKMIPR